MQSVLAFVLYILIVLGLIAFGYGLYRRKGGIFSASKGDALSDEIVTGLMAELRKAQAETSYWKQTAERLQREADDR
ncbi:MAG: hypothetical protein JO246_01730 [Frankiaceae bacterium]|nr:hypothetical protein [Frankiaceae bacterium]MBV9872744.1 hypothetical protein [Frankiaceae bacterium]